MIFLFTFTLTNSITLFALAVLLIRNIYTLASNTTTIEGWEIDRHDTLVRRARSYGGYLDGPDGMKIRIQRQEFPYDIGIYANMRQTIGTGLWAWLWPFAATPRNEMGLEFETNGFEHPTTSWPPPDPDRMPRRQYNLTDHDDRFTNTDKASNINIQAFRERQRRDYLRFSNDDDGYTEMKHRSTYNRSSDIWSDASDDASGEDEHQDQRDDEWRDAEGDRLRDFGVDEDEEEVEYVDEDDIPLSEIVSRRKNVRKAL
ncbi:MAG: hypothetical protein L6R42_010151 [Xanthoria sp. 1 TBL-2021]|nr:MAG: hypothetical protein L6R42_010151 [Xanthoria sp. 1 TBL-2021]